MIESTKRMRFQETVLPHLNSAFNFACWLMNNRQDAEDVVQEAYLRAFKFFDSFHGDDARSWLLAIVRNTSHTWYAQHHTERDAALFDEEVHSVEAQALGSLSQADNNPETLLVQKESERMLGNALSSLPLEFREVMVMRELEDLSYKQIAHIVGIPIGTVMSRLARGRKLLAAVLLHENQEASWTTVKH